MTAPRIISAYEAEGLLRHGTDAELAAATPDLAASVVKLHDRAEQAAAERARIVAPLTERSEADEMGEAWWQNHVRRLTEKHARQIDHNESFYAVRIQAISDLAKQHGIWDEVAAILANGKVSPQDPPTYDHMLAREKARADKAEANYRWMVERAADQRLDGYRELGARCAALEAERDAAADAERARIAARIKELADKAYAVGNEPRGDALLNASRILETSRVTP